MDEITAFVRSQPVRRFAKDSILIYQGELPTALYAIRSGFVKMYDLSTDGSEQLVGFAGKYDFIPSELLMTDQVAAQFFYAAFTPVEVFVIDRQAFMARIRGDSKALFLIVQTVTEKYLRLRLHLTAAQKPKAREKIVHALYFLSTYFADESRSPLTASQLAASADRPVAARPHRIVLPITQQDIANLVGISRETAAHELKLLKAEGYISYGKTVFVINGSLERLID